jgi:hypothetical protein
MAILAVIIGLFVAFMAFGLLVLYVGFWMLIYGVIILYGIFAFIFRYLPVSEEMQEKGPIYLTVLVLLVYAAYQIKKNKEESG